MADAPVLELDVEQHKRGPVPLADGLELRRVRLGDPVGRHAVALPRRRAVALVAHRLALHLVVVVEHLAVLPVPAPQDARQEDVQVPR